MKRLVETFDMFSSEGPQMTMGQEPTNYMFFSNLETIHRLTGILLEMDPSMIDSIIENGHDWAADHIATSKDDIEEVVNFFIGEAGDETEARPEMHGTEEVEEGYMCNECGSMYEMYEVDEDLSCNECGGSLIIMEKM
jgi:DNA-directed RNA polymerase subunit RPC12/RpoP